MLWVVRCFGTRRCWGWVCCGDCAAHAGGGGGWKGRESECTDGPEGSEWLPAW